MLTILLTLNGRVPFTERWLRWCQFNRCPYKILIADSSSDDAVKHLLDGPVCQDLEVEYVRYPEDLSLRFYFRKLADAAGRASTRFVIHADNDDFLLFGALAESLGRADEQDEMTVYARPYYRFVSRLNDKDLSAHLYPANGIVVQECRLGPGATTLADGDPRARLAPLVGRLEWASWLWYGISSSSFLRGTHRRTMTSEYSLAMFSELYFMYSAAIRGRCIVEPGSPFLARQEGTSTGAASLYNRERLDYIYMNPTWSRDLERFILCLFHDFRSMGCDVGYDEFSEFLKDSIWRTGKEKTKFTYWADAYRSRKIGKYVDEMRRIFRSREYRPLTERAKSADLRLLHGFLSTGFDGS